MKKKIPTMAGVAIAIAACLSSLTADAQQNFQIPNVQILGYSGNTSLPNFFKFNDDANLSESDFPAWITSAFHLPLQVSFRSYDSQKDQQGMTHTRYREYVNNIPVDGSMVIVHSKDGRMMMINGDYFLNVNTSFSATVSEAGALTSALGKVNAVKYKWENAEETKAMKEAFAQPDFSYYPKGELVIVHKQDADYSASNMRLAYKFNIYAEKPLSRAYIYVDAQTGKVISSQDIIHTVDVVGTANTKFSGTQAMTSDNYGTPTQYRLRETGRGNGVNTYNLATSTTYSNTDFTNTSATWNITGTNQAATDAHWGAEKTYDYYYNTFGRNSIDGAGYNLLSYVHYDVNYDNAFWDGTRMTYGDGNVSTGFLIMTALDVCGHEITHGLTNFTAGLGGGEADALNEGFSDIFGTTIEAYARPSDWDWKIGSDITCTSAGVADNVGIRNMSNPNAFGQPDTYMGTYWDAGGEPHTNNGPSIFWYYLLCQGGSGTNDAGQSYSVTGITMAEAQLIAFRGLTNYFTPGTNYANARTYTIQAAVDLFGGCSPEVIATTNAWHAVGVGAAFTPTPTVASFTANAVSACSLPFTVNFTNTSVNGGSASWTFGDGGTSTALNPGHTYTAPGTYNVKLVASSACGTDSVLHSSYITITLPASPSGTPAFSCASPASLTLGASGSGTLAWYTASTGGSSVGTGTSYTTPSLSSSTTYYVESQITGASGNVGPATTTFGTGAYHNNSSTQYLIFDVLQPCTLQTVLVNSGAAGTRNVMLWDNAGTLLQTIPVAFPSGTGTVTLNLHLNPGTGYRIGGTMMNLYRNNTGAAYPYTLSGMVNITGSSAGSAYYYYLYNWHLQADPCISARIPVLASVGGPSVTYSAASYDSVCVTDPSFTLTGGSPSGGTYSGAGVSGTTFDPATAGTGSHPITYSYTDGGGCSNSVSQTVYVDGACVPTGLGSSTQLAGVSLYPNPTGGTFTLELGLTSDESLVLEISNAIGQVMLREQHEYKAGNNKTAFDLAQLPRGVYILKLKGKNMLRTERIVLN
ncbi:MAG: M4 family metallopeptidase [Bacteroidia bacterium]